jgi:hypothetical protein
MIIQRRASRALLLYSSSKGRYMTTGTVKWFNATNCYGFITPSTGARKFSRWMAFSCCMNVDPGFLAEACRSRRSRPSAKRSAAKFSD